MDSVLIGTTFVNTIAHHHTTMEKIVNDLARCSIPVTDWGSCKTEPSVAKQQTTISLPDSGRIGRLFDYSHSMCEIARWFVRC
jgi:hypothetical protein